MGFLKQFVRQSIVHVSHLLLPRKIRVSAIKAMILAEEASAPRDAVRWLLEVEEYVAGAIDAQCTRWGNGVHIKHELMNGIHTFFCERISAGASVLDIGCGRGTVAYAMAVQSQAQVLGVDLNAGHIAFARKHYRHPNLRFEVGDVIKEVPGVQADVIVLSSVLEHLPNRAIWLRQLVERFHPQKFLIRVPTFENHFFAALKQELGLFPYRDPTHFLEYSPASFAAEMQEAELTIHHLEIRWGDIWAECIPQASSVDGNKAELAVVRELA